MPVQVDDNNILLYLVRHGQTSLNQKNCFRGPMNPPLDEVGVQQAHRLAFYMKPIEVSAIFCSDKIRAKTTADIIARERGQEVVSNEGLRAWDVGWFGGKPKDEFGDQLQYYVNNPDVDVPDGESLNTFRNRVRPLFGEAIKHALDAGKPVLMVVHSSLIHELGEAVNGHHSTTLVLPGGVAAAYINKGQLCAEPIFRPDDARLGSRVETVS